MVSVLTGDIIKSRKATPDIWLPELKSTLSRFGGQPEKWEIFRGDSFQLLINNPADALKAAIYIKASMRKVEKTDVRIAIGIGQVAFDAGRITESNGAAFEYSGMLLEELKKRKLNLAVRTDNSEFDEEMNLYFRLALIVMDKWTANSAEIITVMIDNAGQSQEEIGRLLKIKQNAVSARLKRAHYHEIMELDCMFRRKVKRML